jgi:hypothetical protein
VIDVDSLTWTLHELATGRQIGLLDGVLPGSWVDVEVAARRSAWLKLSTEDPHAGDIYPLGVVLRAWQAGLPIFAGVLQQPTIDGAEGTIEVPALGPRGRLEAFQLGMRSGDPSLPGHTDGLPYRWDQVPQGEMLRRLVAYANPTPAELAAGIPSHGIVDGTIVPGQARDRQYDPGKSVAEAIDELTNVTGGPDWDLPTIWDPARPWALARLDVLPSLGTDRTASVVFEHQVGKENASNLRWMPGGDDGGPAVNRFLGVGEAPAYDGEAADAPAPPSFVGNQVDSQVAFGLYTKYEALSGVTEEANVAGQVAAVLATSSFPVDHFEVTPIPGAVHFSPAGDLWLGDTFTARGQTGSIEMSLEGRATGARITVVDETGATAVAIRAAPRENRAVSS